MKKYFPLLKSLLIFLLLRQGEAIGQLYENASKHPYSLPIHTKGVVEKNHYTSYLKAIKKEYSDALYVFNSDQSGLVQIVIKNIQPADATLAMTLWEGNPSNKKEMAYTLEKSDEIYILKAPIVKNTSYAVLVDQTSGSGKEMNFSIDVALVSIDLFDNLPHTKNNPVLLGPGCINADFENNNFSNWTGNYGTVNFGAPNDPYPIYTPGTMNMANPHHTLMTPANGNDQCGGFQICPPGRGNYVCRLGDGNNAGRGGASMQYVFTPSAAYPIFTYWYAVVVEDASGHAPREQPFFKIEMKDVQGNLIPCGQFLVVGGPNIPGFQLSNNFACFNTYYKTWTPASVDLTAFIGNPITVTFTTGDCALGAHWSYAYVDAECTSPQLIIPDTVCVGQNAQACAPPGFGTYSWANGATTQCINVPTGTTGQFVYTCTVTPPGQPGCPAVIKDTITVVPSPAANFTHVAPVSCQGGVVPFTNTTTPASNYSWSWTFGDPASGANNSSNQQNPSHNYSSSGSYTVTLYAFSGACVDTSIHIVTILGNSISSNFSANTVCQNSPTSFSASSPDSASITAWSWNFGDGTSGTGQYVNHTYSNAGTYNVTLIVFGGPGGTCKDSIKHVVTVNPLPKANFSASPVCIGNSTQFTDLSSTNISAWTWNFCGAGTSNVQNPIYSFSSPGTCTVILSVTDANGCSNNISLPVTVLPLPVPSFSATQVCVNNPTLFTDQSTVAGGNILSWNWNFGDPNSSSNTSNLANPTHTYLVSGAYLVTLTVTTGNGCTATYTDSIQVNPGPTSKPAGIDVCLGVATNFSDASIVSTGGVINNWVWNFGDPSSGANNTSGLQNPTHVYSQPGLYTASLLISTTNGCSHIDSIQVNVWPKPTTDFSAKTVCQGQATLFNNLSGINQGSIIQYNWNFGDPLSAANNVSIVQHPSHLFSNSGTYQVFLQITSDKGCRDSTIKTIVVEPLPVPFFIADDTAGCIPHCVNFSDLSTVTTGNIAYWTWTFGDNSSGSTMQNPQHCYTTPGVWDISLTATTVAGCSATYTNNQYIVTHGWPQADFFANPNPTNVWNTNINFTDLSLNSSSGSIVSWSWTFGDNTLPETIQHPVHLYPSDNTGIFQYTVWLYIIDNNGCSSSISHEIKIYPEFTFYAPNTFTPNGDGVNDLFFTYATGVKEFKIMIFHRWGDLIWQSDDLQEGWDGTVANRTNSLVQEDTYVWKVVLTDVFDKQHQYVGHVNVIR